MEKIFKAKRIDTGEWVVFEFDDLGSCDGETVHYQTGEILDLDNVCQYTGIDDSQGQRIFEGDRCLYCGSEVIIEYSTSACAYVCKGVNWDDYLWNCLANGVTLTGKNKHDKD